jgi:putative Mg2+ transporter-C (MgtC) family protein
MDWMSIGSIFLRMGLAAIIGAAIGIDRVKKKRPAGIKTHALLCMGSALVMLTGEYLVSIYGFQTDVARLAAQVVSGVGFLGAGTIMVTGRSQVKGLTTAAGLWFSATLGLAIGAGFYSGAFISTFFMFLVIRVFSIYDLYLQKRSFVMDLYLEYTNQTSIGNIFKVLKANQCQINEMEKLDDSGDRHSLMLSIRIPKHWEHNQVVGLFETHVGITHIEEF